MRITKLVVLLIAVSLVPWPLGAQATFPYTSSTILSLHPSLPRPVQLMGVIDVEPGRKGLLVYVQALDALQVTIYHASKSGPLGQTAAPGFCNESYVPLELPSTTFWHLSAEEDINGDGRDDVVAVSVGGDVRIRYGLGLYWCR